MICILIVIVTILISFVICLIVFRYYSKQRVAQCANCNQDFDYKRDGIDIMSRFRKCPHCNQVTFVTYHKKYK
jgi:hypothetical protein